MPILIDTIITIILILILTMILIQQRYRQLTSDFA